MEPFENCADRRTRGCSYPLCKQTGETDCSVITGCPRDGDGNPLLRSPACSPVKAAPSIGALVIAAERKRVIEKEGFTPRHDAQHQPDELAIAGAAYAVPPGGLPKRYVLWPWGRDQFKPGVPWNAGARLVDTPEARLADLRRAGQFIAAAIDLLVEDNPHLQEEVLRILEEGE